MSDTNRTNSAPFGEAIFSFGAWVGQRRQALRLTQQEVASLVGCSVVLIRKIEGDARRPSVQVAERLARALHVPPRDIPAFVRTARAEQAADRLQQPAHGISRFTVNAEPSLVSFLRAAGNLPAPVSSFVGRRRELAELQILLQRRDLRLLTLTGAGGSGKTRLAIEVVRTQMDAFPAGIWFVDLAPVTDPAQVAAAIAQVLGIPESPTRPIIDGLREWLRERQVLLLIDNCEHVITAVASIAADLLRSAAALTIVATSRMPVRITAEHEYAVEPLQVPKVGRSVATHYRASLPNNLLHYDAVALFLARAQAIRTDMTLTATTAAPIAEICAYLDGLPLAIELAAARIRIFAPEQLLEQLRTARLQILRGGARDLPARQQTIQATIDWSYRLLTRSQQILLARLSVFVGGWTLAAAEAVCGDPAIDLIAGMDALLEHSLVHVIAGTDPHRYTMLETIREYASEQLVAYGEVVLSQQRHADYIAWLANQEEIYAESLSQLFWFEQLDQERANIHAALKWAYAGRVHPSHQRVGFSIIGRLSYYWRIRREPERRYWLDAWLPHVDTTPSYLRCTLFYWRARIYVDDREGHRAFALAQQALEDARAIAWMQRFADILRLLGLLTLSETGDVIGARQYLEEALAVGEQVGDPRLIADGHQDLVTLFLDTREHARARLHGQQGLSWAHKTTNLDYSMYGLYQCGRVELANECFDAAQTCFRAALDISQQLGAPDMILGASVGLAAIAQKQGNLTTARELGNACLATARDLQEPYQIAMVLTSLGLTELIDGHLDVAAVYLRESYGLQEQHLHHRRAIETSIRLAEVLRLQGDTMAAEALYHAVLAFKHPQIGLWLWAAAYLGLAHLHGNDQSRRSGYHYLAESLIRWRAIMSREGIARSLETIARTFESDPIRAARFWGAAEALREQIGAFMWPIDRPEYVRCVAEAQAQVDAVEWAAAWTAGRALTWEQAADQALVWLQH